MRYLNPLFLLILCIAPCCRAATLTTKDGQSLTGDLKLTQDRITLTPKDAPSKSFALQDISQATFAPLASAAPAAYGKPRQDKRVIEPARLFVEYFADTEFKDRRFARYESQILTQWDQQHPPDPAIPSPCYIRYSGQILPKYSEDYTFTTDVQGKLRLWINGELKIDRSNKSGGDHGSCVATLKANVPVAFRMEVIPGRYTIYNRISFSSRSQHSEWIPAVAFVFTADSVKAPQVSLNLTKTESLFRDPPSIGFDIHVGPADDKIQAVDVLNDKEVLGTMKSPPFHCDWTNPPSGQYHIKARAIDDKGIAGYSESIEFTVGGAGDAHSLPAPWAEQTLGKKAERVPGTASFDKGTFKLRKAGGQITEEDDAPLFVYQPVSGDFQITAHLADMTPDDNAVGPLAGLLVRENVLSSDRFVAAVVGPGATTIARRHDDWARITSSDRVEPAANWLKMIRHGTRLRAYTSQDGKAWSLLGADHIDLPEQVFVGLCAMTRDKEKPVLATFDNVSITLGPPEFAYSAPGLLFRSGSFLAAEVLGYSKDGATLAYNRNGKRTYAPSPDIARLIYKPITTEIAKALPNTGTGALLGSGDFIEGDLKELSWRVTVSNVVFGPRTFDIKGSEVLAVCLKEADAPTLKYILTATDGSIYQSNSIKINKDTISIEDPSLGSTTLPLTDLAQLKVQ